LTSEPILIKVGVSL